MSTTPSGRRQIVIEHTSSVSASGRKKRVSGFLSTVSSVLRRSQPNEVDELRRERKRLLLKIGRLVVKAGALPLLNEDAMSQLARGIRLKVSGDNVDWGYVRRLNDLSERVRWLDAQIAALKHEEDQEVSAEVAIHSELLASEDKAHQALDGVPTEDLQSAYQSAVRDT
jgi:hypothetical protein